MLVFNIHTINKRTDTERTFTFELILFLVKTEKVRTKVRVKIRLIMFISLTSLYTYFVTITNMYNLLYYESIKSTKCIETSRIP